MFDIWTISSQVDVEMSQTDSIIHWKIHFAIRRNYIIVDVDPLPWLLHQFLSVWVQQARLCESEEML